MRVITKRERIFGVSQRWNEQHQSPRYDGTDRRTIGDKLALMDLTTATADEVDAVIGNSSWTRLECNECKLDVDAVIHLGRTSEDYDPDYQAVDLCIRCANNAYSLLKVMTQ